MDRKSRDLVEWQLIRACGHCDFEQLQKLIALCEKLGGDLRLRLVHTNRESKDMNYIERVSHFAAALVASGIDLDSIDSAGTLARKWSDIRGLKFISVEVEDTDYTSRTKS